MYDTSQVVSTQKIKEFAVHLEFISNTGCYLEHNGTVIGMDLWFYAGSIRRKLVPFSAIATD